MEGRPVLVTGGGGFIGSNLVRALVERGDRVRVMDDFSTGSRENLADVAGTIELIDGSVLEPDALEAAMAGISVVFHEAAIPSVSRSVEDPARSHHANATGTLCVLAAARAARVERLVYASSSSIYGGEAALPATEELPARPVSPYAVSKLAGENYCRAFTSTFSFPTISLRYFNVFGPRQDPFSEYAAVIPRFALAMMNGERPVVHGDGRQSRDFTYVDNVVQGNLVAAEAPAAAFGGVFNLAQGGRCSLLDLLAMLGGMLGVDPDEVEWAPARPGDVRHSQADIGAARRILGFRPSVTFEEGIARTVDWLRTRAARAA